MSQDRHLKVCMIVHLYYYRDVRVQRYADSLIERGAEVDVICVRSPDPSLIRHDGPVNVYTIPLSHFPRQGMLAYLLEYTIACVLYTLWLLALYARKRYHVVHVHNMPDFLIFAGLIPRLLGARLILDVHDAMPEFYMSKYAQTDAQGGANSVVRLMCWQEKLSIASAQAVIAAAPTIRDNLVERGTASDKITVVNNLPDLHIFDRNRYPQVHTDGFRLLYPGTIAPRYGLDVAIRALPLLVPDIPDLQLVIIGQLNEHAQELADFADQLGVAAHVEFRSLCPVQRIAELMRQSDVGIYPALSDPHMEIAMPTKVLEYAAMGLPVVASRLRILEATFSEASLIFCSPGDVNAFAAGVLALYCDPAFRRRMVDEADRVFVQARTWEHERIAYFDLLRRLLDDTHLLAVSPVETERVSRAGDGR